MNIHQKHMSQSCSGCTNGGTLMDCDEKDCHRTVCSDCVAIPQSLRTQPGVKFTCPACHLQRDIHRGAKTPYTVNSSHQDLDYSDHTLGFSTWIHRRTPGEPGNSGSPFIFIASIFPARGYTFHCSHFIMIRKLTGHR